MSFALVVIATITLVVGLLQSGLTLIYVSIGCSVLAGLVLAVAVLRGRPEGAPAAAPAKRERVPAGAGAPTSAGGPSTPAPPSGDRPWQSTDTSAGDVTAPSGWSPPPPPSPAPEPAPESTREPEYAGVGSRPWATDRTEQMDVASAVTEPDREFPIENYDRLRASEILRLLPDLSPQDLEKVREREVAGMNRFTVLSRIDAQLETATTGDWGTGDQEWAVRSEEDVAVVAGADQPAGADDVVTEEEPEPAPVGRLRATRRPAAKTPSARTAPARKSTRRPRAVSEEAEAEAPAEAAAPPAPTRRSRPKPPPIEEAAAAVKRAGSKVRKVAAKVLPDSVAPDEPAEPAEPAPSRRPPTRVTEAEPAPRKARAAKAGAAEAREPAAKKAAKKAAGAVKAPPKKAAAKKAAPKKAAAEQAAKAPAKAPAKASAKKAPAKASAKASAKKASAAVPVKKASRARKSPGT